LFAILWTRPARGDTPGRHGSAVLSLRLNHLRAQSQQRRKFSGARASRSYLVRTGEHLPDPAHQPSWGIFVRPEVGIGNVTGLQTVLSGPEIRLVPGNGEPRSDFAGLEDAPPGLERKGLSIKLQAGRPGFLRPNSPIYYRGVEVGVVRDIQLNANATAVDIQVFIERRYATWCGATRCSGMCTARL